MDNLIDHTNKMPVFFIGHGNPMNAISNNPFTQSLSAMGKDLTMRPKAIMVVSAHWLTRGTYVCNNPNPNIIYDFSGFPRELFNVKYPVVGSPEYTKEVVELVPEIKETSEWGLDHGAWSILKHIFPEANIPVFQLSIDFYQPMQYHFDLASKLMSLRNNGLLIIGSGNVVHNLRLAYWEENPVAFEWNIEFDEWVKEKIEKRDFNSLINYERAGKAAKLAVPTADHYIPLIYCLALSEPNDDIKFTYEGLEMGSMSMRSFRVG